MVVKLLIVDDSDVIRHSLVALLRGFLGPENIRSVATLSAALENVRSAWPNMVVLDLQLADGSATPHISPMLAMAPGIRIAVLTNDASGFNRVKCLQAGAHWFFDKSTEFENLLDVVRKQAAAVDIPPAPA